MNNKEETLSCSKCELDLPIHFFSNKKQCVSRKGKAYVCKGCASLSAKKRKGIARYGKKHKCYIIHCKSPIPELIEEFIKVGYSGDDLKYRLTDFVYEYEIIKEIHTSSEVDARELERKIHCILKSKGYSYLPRLRFGGKYECFHIDSLLEVSNIADELIQMITPDIKRNVLLEDQNKLQSYLKHEYNLPNIKIPNQMND